MDIYHEKVVDRIIEIEETVEEPINVNLKQVEGVLQVNDRKTIMPLNTRTRSEFIS